MADAELWRSVLLDCLLSFPPGTWPLTVISKFDPLLLLYSRSRGGSPWGVGMGAQESIMKAAAAAIPPAARRSSAFDTFNMNFGIFWFVGSALMGVLYDRCLPGVKDILNELARVLPVHVLTADTFGRSREELEGVGRCRG